LEPVDKFYRAGQSLWLDHVDREQIYNGSLMQFIEREIITGLIISPQAVCHTINNSSIYDDGIYTKLGEGLIGESLALDLILEDTHHAADLLRHVFNRSDGIDGWVALPISPLLTSEPAEMLQSVLDFHARVNRKNALITIPGLPKMLGTVEELVFAGVPINISFIYSRDQFLSVAAACLRGIERRIAAQLNPAGSVFVTIQVSRLAAELAKEMKQQAVNKACIALTRNIYNTMRTEHASQPWERTFKSGGRPIRLLWSLLDDGTATAQEVALCNSLITSLTVAVMSERAMMDCINHGLPDASMPADTNDTDGVDEVLANLQKAGLSFRHLAGNLQNDAAAWQVKEWITLLDAVARKSADVMQMKPERMYQRQPR
jgi:transaldolase